ncbi:glutamine-binding protein [Arthrobacter sp. Hiyo8]|nr:glutamine-binding protein [Arthrobacter sp. Hiyo8]
MKSFITRRKSLLVAASAALALSLSACGGGGGSTTAPSSESAPFTVAQNVSITGSPTFDKIKSNGKITIGVKQDQPGLGFKDAATGEYSGFDIQVAQWIAASLGFSKDKIEYKPIPSANRESAITNGDIDYYVGTYSITDKRKQLVDFAGPYFVTGQGLLVKKSNTTINSEKDLSGKNVCSATGSTPSRTSRQTSQAPKPLSSTRTHSVSRRSRAARSML